MPLTWSTRPLGLLHASIWIWMSILFLWSTPVECRTGRLWPGGRAWLDEIRFLVLCSFLFLRYGYGALHVLWWILVSERIVWYNNPQFHQKLYSTVKFWLLLIYAYLCAVLCAVCYCSLCMYNFLFSWSFSNILFVPFEHTIKKLVLSDT